MLDMDMTPRGLWIALRRPHYIWQDEGQQDGSTRHGAPVREAR